VNGLPAIADGMAGKFVNVNDPPSLKLRRVKPKGSTENKKAVPLLVRLKKLQIIIP
jgi:hypothetical protein